VTRANRSDNKRHVIVGTQTYSPREVAGMLSLKEANMWGIIYWLVDKFLGPKEAIPEGEDGTAVRHATVNTGPGSCIRVSWACVFTILDRVSTKITLCIESSCSVSVPVRVCAPLHHQGGTCW
jgi:hypothetical protein